MRARLLRYNAATKTFVRTVLAAGLFAGALLATSAPAWAEKVTIPPQGALPAIPGDLERPAGPGPFPAVLVLHGCEGPPPPGLRAAVAYYPACENRLPNVSVPLQILDGDADDWTIPGPCQRLAADATTAGKTVVITTYPGVTHDFNRPRSGTQTYLGHTLRYDAGATKDAAAKTAAFLATYLK